MKKILFFSLICILLFTCVASALELPPGLQKVLEYNNEQAVYYLEAISYFVAFLGGLLALLSPCTLATIPMYFSYGLEKRSTLHTLTFFLGFTTVFISLGLIASAIGQSILLFQSKNSSLIFIAGLFLILFGIMQILGKGFSFLPVKVFKAKSLFGVFLLGMLFALGWTACTGPILGGVLLIATVLGSYLKVALLMFFYALGNFVPFFLLSFFVDGFRLSEVSWIKGKLVSFTIFGKKYETHTTQIVSGILLVFIGLLFLLFQGTSYFNTIVIGDLSLTGYDLQRSLLTNSVVPIVGMVLFGIFVGLLVYFLFRKK